MGAAERRMAILKYLCRKRHATIEELAIELGVSMRTIRRDISIISLSEPIYTKAGRYEQSAVYRGIRCSNNTHENIVYCHKHYSDKTV